MQAPSYLTLDNFILTSGFLLISCSRDSDLTSFISNLHQSRQLVMPETQSRCEFKRSSLDVGLGVTGKFQLVLESVCGPLLPPGDCRIEEIESCCFFVGAFTGAYFLQAFLCFFPLPACILKHGPSEIRNGLGRKGSSEAERPWLGS